METMLSGLVGLMAICISPYLCSGSLLMFCSVGRNPFGSWSFGSAPEGPGTARSETAAHEKTALVNQRSKPRKDPKRIIVCLLPAQRAASIPFRGRHDAPVELPIQTEA